MTARAVLERETFEISRASEYFDRDELQKQTGQPVSKFATVVLKELVDNALDGAESEEIADVAPAVDIETSVTDGDLTITVSDNGIGIAPETVQRILNFETRTSDKLAYRSPTRGAQGNGLKTIIGIPYSLGRTAPVIIRSRGTEHRIHIKLDMAGGLHINPVIEKGDDSLGTCISVTLPAYNQAFDSVRLARSYALFNPHAAVKIRHIEEHSDDDVQADSETSENTEFYQSTTTDWRKCTRKTPTAPSWYDLDALTKLIFAHIGMARKGGKDKTLRDFVREFNGLNGTQKAAAVCAQLPEISRLTDFEDREGDIPILLTAMREAARPVKPEALGVIGEPHFQQRLNEWYGVKRFWYQKKADEVNGVPFVIEVAVAETDQPGAVFAGVNFSSSYGDPFARTWLSNEEISTTGLHSFLHRAYIRSNTNTAVAVHLTSPGLQFLDRGKTQLELPRGMATAIAQTIWRAVKELYKEGRRSEKDAGREERRRDAEEKEQAREKQITIKEAVFKVIPEAAPIVSEDGKYRYSQRNFFYTVRDMIQQYTDKELTYTYFRDTLLVEYQRIHGKLLGMYADPRGWLIEPHTGKIVRMGTREVEEYKLPSYLYNKILYIEKKGMMEQIADGRFAQRYDMAVILGEGYACEAVYELLERADKQHKCKVFVLHDADPDGYWLATKLREATDRMPGYSVDVVDLGLSVEDAQRLGLSPEKFTRKKAFPSELQLSPLAEQMFTGKLVKVQGKKQWKDCLRIELNKLPPAMFIKLLDEKLQANGGYDKVIPPDDVLQRRAEDIYHTQLRMEVNSVIDEMLSAHDIACNLADDLQDDMEMDKAREWIDAGFEENISQPWDAALDRAVRSKIDELLDVATIKQVVRDAIERTNEI